MTDPQPHDSAASAAVDSESGSSAADAAGHVVEPPRGKAERGFRWIGYCLVGGWLLWVCISLIQLPLARAVPAQRDYAQYRYTYILLEPLIGLDFHHNYTAARSWWHGGDPYTALVGDPVNDQFVYPPLTLVTFAWTNLIPPGHSMLMRDSHGNQQVFAPSEAAIFAWLAVIVGIIAYSGQRSRHNRRQWGLPDLPYSFVLGTLLCSYPVLFEFERGNCDVLPLIAIALLVSALSWSNRWTADVVIGICVAFALGIKPYAIVLLPGLLALRRFRGALVALVATALQIIALWPEFVRWMAVGIRENAFQAKTYMDYSHTIVGHWRLIWRDLGAPGIARVPAQISVTVVLIIAVSGVAWQVYRRPSPAVAWPFLLWLTAVGTMLLPISFDYNLLFVPLLVLATWNASDRWPVQFCAGLVVLWGQPFVFGLAGLPLLALKAASVLCAGFLVTERLKPVPASLPLSPWSRSTGNSLTRALNHAG